LESPKARNRFEDIGIDGRIVSERILEILARGVK
jgi:hypothetical protein